MYVDAFRKNGRVVVVSRDENGRRHVRRHKVPWDFGVEDPDGDKTGLWGQKLSIVACRDRKDLVDQVATCRRDGKRTFESDVRPEFKVLEREYSDYPIVRPNVALLDIEVDNRREQGWSSVERPFAKVCAITVHRQWDGSSTSVVVPPPTVAFDDALSLFSDMPDVYVLPTEKAMLDAFLHMIEDADITVGWNSARYDMPYLVHRARCVSGDRWNEIVKDGQVVPPPDEAHDMLTRFCIGDLPIPKMVADYGAVVPIYSFAGRPHLDYMELYQKYTLEEKHSYALDAILLDEVGRGKLRYDDVDTDGGALYPLEALYLKDPRRYVEYNRRDTLGLDDLDRKRGLIDLATELSHLACVTYPKVLGSVALIEQAITRKLHEDGRMAPDKKEHDKVGKIAGAFVLEPKPGLYGWTGSYDVSSLYPSVIRMLNVGPETLVGQIEPTRTNAEIARLKKAGLKDDEAWAQMPGTLEYRDVVAGSDVPIVVVLDDGTRIETTAAAWRDQMLSGGMSLSANGTVFDCTEDGILARCLGEWYARRQVARKEMREAESRGDQGGRSRLDTTQSALKLLMNSSYGVLLSPSCRFYDPRLGQSVTLSGRIAIGNMAELASAEFGEGSAIYGDTDSIYALLPKDVSNVDDAVLAADGLRSKIELEMPRRLRNAFFVDEERSRLVKVARERVASRVLFIDSKKKYALMVEDREGIRERKLKMVGIKKTDTPRWAQEAIEDVVSMVMNGASEADVRRRIDSFRATLRSRKPWSCGVSGRVSNVTKGAELRRKVLEEGASGGAPLHYFVKAADNTNRMIDYHGCKEVRQIKDGDKIEVVYLRRDVRKNPFDFDLMAVPVGLDVAPAWLDQIPVDVDAMEERLVDRKLQGIAEVLGWDIRSSSEVDAFD